MSIVNTNIFDVSGGQQPSDCADSTVHPLTIYAHRNEINTYLWDDLLAHSDFASFFQSPACYDLYTQQDFMEPFVIAVASVEELKALVCGYTVQEGTGIKGYMSRRAIVPGGVLIRNGMKPVDIEILLVTLRQYLSSKAIYLELRNYSDYQEYISSFKTYGFDYAPHYNIRLECNRFDDVWAGMSHSKRRQIKQSIEQGVSWSEVSGVSEMQSFYEILNKLYRERVRRPLFPYSFFESLLNCSHVKVLAVRRDGNVIGGIVCVLWSKESVSEWFVCGMDREISGVYPSVMATWAGIQYAIDNGYSRFDFMGAGKPGEKYGVRDFKLRFGGKLVEYGRFAYIQHPMLYQIGKWAIKIQKYLK